MEYFQIGEAFRLAWEKFKAHKVFLWKLLGVIVASQVLFGTLEKITEEMGAFSVLVSIAAVFLTVLIDLGLTRLSLNLIDHNTEGKLGGVFAFNRLFWQYVGASLLFTLIVGAGFFLLVIPGIYFMLKYQFFSQLIVDKNMGVIEALKKSGEITKGVKWQLLGFALAIIGVNLLGALALGFGLLVTIPVTLVAYTIVYRKLSVRLSSSAETVPSVS